MSEQDTRILNYNLQPDTSPQIIRNGESYNLDTREQLEADVYRAADKLDAFYCGERFLDTRKIIGWLDRQAAITEQELCGRCSPYATAKDYLDTIDSLTAERDVLKAKLETYGKVPDQDECKKQQPMESGDTREKLEADVRGYYSHTVSTLVWPPEKNKSTDVLMVPEDTVLSWLDRQAAITRKAERGMHDRILEYLTRENDELTAERDRYEVLAVNAEQWKDERDQLSKDLTAEHALLTQWADAANAQRLVAMEQADKVQELTVERDELRGAIDAMENGQFYAMYRRACEERDELKREHEREREQMQRVIDTQRESFRKMEFELAQAKGGSDDEG